ncbi:MAG: TonB-dependent receptor [Elusimicrobia bacterium]|nr:TonB-dependent receptor [Candidatus Liberimonas magnetica]
MKKEFWLIASLVCACFCFVPQVSYGDSEEQGGEQLFFMEIPSVIAASRREQPVTEAPASVEVVTAQEIRDSGATNIPEAIRMVAGIDLTSISSRNRFVFIRGFHEGNNNFLLVMIDGRSIDWDVYNVVLWDQQQIGLDEIERIEIINGPGSSLYGANAYSGIINIITKTPEQINGTNINVRGGTPSLFNTSIIHGKTTQKVDYKVSAGFDKLDEWKDTPLKDAGQVSRANALVDYKISEKSKLSFSAGRAYGLNQKFFGGENVGVGVNPSGYNNDYAQAAYTLGTLSIRSYVKNADMSIKFPVMSDVWYFKTTNFDVELQHSFEIGNTHSLVWGLDYRNLGMQKNEIVSSDHAQDIYGVFAEDQYQMTDQLKLVLGARYDSHPLIKSQVSTRGALLYAINKDQSILGSVSKAFRNPTLVESYFDRTTTSLVFNPLAGAFVPITAIILGNQNLSPEQVTAYQAEYRYKLSTIEGKVGVFYNQYSDFIVARDAIDPTGVSVTTTFENSGGADNVGAMLGFNVLFTDWLKGTLNYTYAQTREKEDNTGTNLTNEKDWVRQDDPKNRVNAGFDMKFRNGISANLSGQWVDSIVYDYINAAQAESLISLKAYTIVNLCVGYAFIEDRIYASLSAFNLFDQNFYEGVPGTGLIPAGDLSTSEELGRRINIQASYKF